LLPHCHQCELQLKAFFVVLLTKTNNRPIIGISADAEWAIPIIGKLADNQCTSNKNSTRCLLGQIPLLVPGIKVLSLTALQMSNW